jgi:hypothetical protein
MVWRCGAQGSYLPGNKSYVTQWYVAVVLTYTVSKCKLVLFAEQPEDVLCKYLVGTVIRPTEQSELD